MISGWLRVGHYAKDFEFPRFESCIGFRPREYCALIWKCSWFGLEGSWGFRSSSELASWI